MEGACASIAPPPEQITSSSFGQSRYSCSSSSSSSAASSLVRTSDQPSARTSTRVSTLPRRSIFFRRIQPGCFSFVSLIYSASSKRPITRRSSGTRCLRDGATSPRGSDARLFDDISKCTHSNSVFPWAPLAATGCLQIKGYLLQESLCPY